MPEGTPIRAAQSGRVLTSAGGFSQWGEYIRIRHSNALQTGYAHLQLRLAVKGQNVTQGEIIGWCGHTGLTIPPGFDHLHFEVWVEDARVDPAPWFWL